MNIVIVQTRTKVKVTVTDVTTGAVATASGTPTPDNSLTFGSFPLFGGGLLPVADFGTVRMLRPTLANTDLAAWSPAILTRRNGPITQISTGRFHPTTGAFSLVFRNN